jgi:tripartite-type tricarboxylate transporter receptor subunit TctC
MHKLISVVVAACLLSWTALQASAETAASKAAAIYPVRPITLVVPFAPGGPADYAARLYADAMSKDLGQPFIVENRAGADTAIAAQLVARAAPDGYTLLFSTMDVTMVLNPITMKNLPYKPLEDFEPISLAGLTTYILVVPASGPETVQELIAYGRAHPGKLNYGAGIITTRLACYLFSKLAGIDAVFIPYKGSTDVVQGILNGSIQYAVDGVAPHYPMIAAGKERALAKLNKRPLSSLPDLKPLDEVANMPQLGENSSWFGFVAPHGTPAAIVAQLQRSIAKAAEQDDVRLNLLKFGTVATSSTPEEFRSFAKSEIDRWSKVIEESGIQFN